MILTVHESWDRRTQRAQQLAAEGGAASPLLTFYARLLRRQKTVYDSMGSRVTGRVEVDAPLLNESGLMLIHEVARNGPDQLASEAANLLQMDHMRRCDLLGAYWHSRSDRQFFPKAILQPYGEWLAKANMKPAGQVVARMDNRCPFCGGCPQLSILEQSVGSSADASGRRLLCATCLSSWGFRRVLCPSCGEEDERKLGYFHSTAFEHLRVDVCESCRHYIKTVDLARLGVAVPLVDEVAGAPLDLWARERGYTKIELNLVGL